MGRIAASQGSHGLLFYEIKAFGYAYLVHYGTQCWSTNNSQGG